MADPDDFTCTGKVKNVADRELPEVKVVVRLYDNAKREVGKDGIRVETLPLRPGQTSDFKLVYYDAPRGSLTPAFSFETFGTDEILPHRDAR